MADKTGGPAFPVSHYVNSDGATFESAPTGMTMRDWFAGQALSHALSATASHDGCYDYVAAAIGAYEIADAMLAEREE